MSEQKSGFMTRPRQNSGTPTLLKPSRRHASNGGGNSVSLGVSWSRSPYHPPDPSHWIMPGMMSRRRHLPGGLGSRRGLLVEFAAVSDFELRAGAARW